MDIRTEATGGVARIVIDRPDKKNALTVAMYAAMAEAIEAAAEDPKVRVVLIGGGPDIFTAGNDLKDFQQIRADDEDMPVFRFLRAISTCPKVVIAAAEGLAVGIGTTMLLHCDLVVASTEARFSLPFVDLGLVPEAASSLLLPRLIGRQRAALHFIAGEPFDADTAYAYGLVSKLTAPGSADAEAEALAARIAAKPPEAVRITKRLIADKDGTVAERMSAEGKLFGERLRSPETMEALIAFFEKRAPDFSGF